MKKTQGAHAAPGKGGGRRARLSRAATAAAIIPMTLALSACGILGSSDNEAEPSAPASPSHTVSTYSSQLQVVGSIPHSKDSFTEGLEFVKPGVLAESSGEYGKSKVRLYKSSDGSTIKEQKLPESAFGEGLTKVNSDLVQLTWKEGDAYRWNFSTLEKQGNPKKFEGEGWGAAYDSNSKILWTSDGSASLTARNPETMKPIKKVTVADKTGKEIANLNELEMVDGKILANVWKTNYIILIDPSTGAVRKLLDLTPAVEKEFGQTTTPDEKVLNGVAFDDDKSILYVTGKNWEHTYMVNVPALKPNR